MFNSNSVATPIGSLHVAELARLADVTPATVRHYTRVGILSPSRDPENDYRCFSGADLHRLVFTRQAQALGLTIGDIKTVLESVDHGEASCGQVKSLVERRRVSIKEHIAQLQATEARIEAAMRSWACIGDPIPDDGELCPLIERIGATNNRAPHTSHHNGNKRPALSVCAHRSNSGLLQAAPA